MPVMKQTKYVNNMFFQKKKLESNVEVIILLFRGSLVG
jgi:hypothetical protein